MEAYTSECQIAELPPTSTTAASRLVMVMRGAGVAPNGSVVGVGRYLAWCFVAEPHTMHPPNSINAFDHPCISAPDHPVVAALSDCSLQSMWLRSLNGGRSFENCSLSADLMPATICEGSLTSTWRGLGGQALLFTSLPSTNSFHVHGRLYPRANLTRRSRACAPGCRSSRWRTRN